jgi:hypothetical protein
MKRDNKGRFVFVCRVQQFYEDDDPMLVSIPSDVRQDIVNDIRKRCIADGCVKCRTQVEDNLSEPDVMERMGFR